MTIEYGDIPLIDPGTGKLPPQFIPDVGGGSESVAAVLAGQNADTPRPKNPDGTDPHRVIWTTDYETVPTNRFPGDFQVVRDGADYRLGVPTMTGEVRKLAFLNEVPTEPSDIGAIGAPASPSLGDVLTWDGTKWTADEPQGGGGGGGDPFLIVAEGRPDVPASMDAPTQTLVSGAASGTRFVSLDGPDGAWEWQKRAGAWHITNGDTGWVHHTEWDSSGTVTGQALPGGASPVSGQAGFIGFRRINERVYFTARNLQATGSSSSRYAVPVGFRPVQQGRHPAWTNSTLGAVRHTATAIDLEAADVWQWELETFTNDTWPTL